MGAQRNAEDTPFAGRPKVRRPPGAARRSGQPPPPTMWAPTPGALPGTEGRHESSLSAAHEANAYGITGETATTYRARGPAAPPRGHRSAATQTPGGGRGQARARRPGGQLPPYEPPHRRPPPRDQGGSRRDSSDQAKPAAQRTYRRGRGKRLTNTVGRGRYRGGGGRQGGGVVSKGVGGVGRRHRGRRRVNVVRWGGAVSAVPFKSGASAAGVAGRRAR